jgi:hypothetical protein
MESIWLSPNQGSDAHHRSWVNLARPEADAKWRRSAQLVMPVPPAVCTRTKSESVTAAANPIDYSFLEEGNFITQIYINNSGGGDLQFRCHPDDVFVSVGNGVTLEVSIDPVLNPDLIPELKMASGSGTALIITSVII